VKEIRQVKSQVPQGNELGIFKGKENSQQFVRGGGSVGGGRPTSQRYIVSIGVLYRYYAARSISDRHSEKQWKRKRPMCVLAGIRY